MDLRLPAVPGSVKQARDSVLTLSDLGEDARQRARLVVSELFSNLLRDPRLDEEDIVEVHLTVRGGSLAGEVVGPGEGVDLISVFSRVDPREDDGRGLRIVDRLVDQWGVVVDGVLRVWFEIEPHH